MLSTPYGCGRETAAKTATKYPARHDQLLVSWPFHCEMLISFRNDLLPGSWRAPERLKPPTLIVVANLKTERPGPALASIPSWTGRCETQATQRRIRWRLSHWAKSGCDDLHGNQAASRAWLEGGGCLRPLATPKYSRFGSIDSTAPRAEAK